jgi:hypothetical protein
MGSRKKEGIGLELTKVSLVTHGLGFRKEGIGPELGPLAEPAPTVVPWSKPVLAGYSFVFNNRLGRFLDFIYLFIYSKINF